MLEANKDLSIDISYGDIFDVPFNIKGLKLAEDGEVIFAIKRNLGDDTPPLILKQKNNINHETNSVRVVIESDEMAKLLPGKYFYELTYKFGKNSRKLNYPARLVVWEVVHDEWN